MAENNVKNLKRLAYYDGLSNLKKREAFEEDIAKLNIEHLTIAAIDANNLKKMNDTFGHEMGDKLIIAVAEVISEIFGEEYSYRTGGDEFLAILESKDDELIAKIYDIFKQKMDMKDKMVEKDLIISAAIGFSKGEEGKSLNAMLKEADEKMYEDKRQYKITQKTKDDKDRLKGVINKEYTKKLKEEQKYTKHLIVSSIIKIALTTGLVILISNFIM